MWGGERRGRRRGGGRRRRREEGKEGEGRGMERGERRHTIPYSCIAFISTDLELVCMDLLTA